jgi:hypothetical protein
MIGFQKSGPQPCFYCGHQAEGYDHLHSRACGGVDIGSNLVPACNRCNSRKGRRSLEQYRLYVGLIERRYPVIFYGEQHDPIKRDWLFVASPRRGPSLVAHNEAQQ